MKITQTIELSDEERNAVQVFLKMADEISEVAGCSMDEVFSYFADKANVANGQYTIDTLHQIADIGM